VSELRRSLIRLIARLVGVDRITENPEIDTEFELLLSKVERGVRSKFVDDPETVVREALNAQQRMADEYFAESHERRAGLHARVRAGELDDSALPNDVMSLVVRHHEYYESFGPDAANRELSLLLVAAVGSTVNAICFAIRDLDAWLLVHPEDESKRTDKAFLQRCFAESLRLGQSNDLFRVATEDCLLPSGIEVKKGEVAVMDRPAGNRDLEGSKADTDYAERYNPYRSLERNVAQYGLAFGGGAHMCLGKDLSVGSFPRLASEESDQLGLAVRTVLALQEHGARVKPGSAELVEAFVGRPTWQRLVVTCQQTNPHAA
jgi:cytochrome P450